jgi:hypothetical protein
MLIASLMTLAGFVVVFGGGFVVGYDRGRDRPRPEAVRRELQIASRLLDAERARAKLTPVLSPAWDGAEPQKALRLVVSNADFPQGAA